MSSSKETEKMLFSGHILKKIGATAWPYYIRTTHGDRYTFYDPTKNRSEHDKYIDKQVDAWGNLEEYEVTKGKLLRCSKVKVIQYE